MRYSCVVFDFDGTIADTMETARLIYNKIADKNGFESVESADVAELQLLKTHQIIKRLGITKHKLPRLVRQGRTLFNAEAKNIALFPEMETCLKKLRDNTEILGILSNNSSANITTFLDHNNLFDFDFIHSTSFFRSKRRQMKSIIEKYKLAPEKVIYIGDEATDIEAAKKNSIDTIAVTWGYHSSTVLHHTAPTHLAESPAQLLDILSR